MSKPKMMRCKTCNGCGQVGDGMFGMSNIRQCPVCKGKAIIPVTNATKKNSSNKEILKIALRHIHNATRVYKGFECACDSSVGHVCEGCYVVRELAYAEISIRSATLRRG